MIGKTGRIFSNHWKILCLLVATSSWCGGATLYVQPDSPYPGLPYNAWSNAAHAIQTAVDASAPGDTVVVAAGVYDSGGTVVYGNMTNRVAVTKAITLRSASGPASTIIRGQGPLGSTAIRCVYLTNGATLVGFTLTNGYTTLSGSVWEEESGGGVWGEGGSAVSNCIITGCAAFHGGGAYGRTNLWLVDCTLVGNSAWGGYAWSGGGAYSCFMSNCVVTGNRANWGGGTAGVVLYNCTVSSNTAGGYGGGVLTGMAIDSTIADNKNFGWGGGGLYESRAQNCSIRGNYSTNGGGVYWSYITNCVIESNSATYGGGTYNGVVVRCILRGNVASNSGGGLYDGTIRGCLVAGNSAREGGGGTYFLNGGSLENCTVAGNSSDYAGGLCFGSADNCEIYSNSASAAQAAQGRQNYLNATLNRTCTEPLPESGANNFTNAPCFVSAEGGDYRLAPDSPCIDAGTNKAWMSDSIDLDGRPRIIHRTVDLGAYEALLADWDTDADRMRDWQEIYAGTDPDDSNSFLYVEAVVSSEAAGNVVRWPSVDGKRYRVDRSTNLVSDPFLFNVQSNIPAVTPMNTVTDTTAVGDGPWCYRVQVE